METADNAAQSHRGHLGRRGGIDPPRVADDSGTHRHGVLLPGSAQHHARGGGERRRINHARSVPARTRARAYEDGAVGVHAAQLEPRSKHPHRWPLGRLRHGGQCAALHRPPRRAPHGRSRRVPRLAADGAVAQHHSLHWWLPSRACRLASLRAPHRGRVRRADAHRQRSALLLARPSAQPRHLGDGPHCPRHR